MTSKPTMTKVTDPSSVTPWRHQNDLLLRSFRSGATPRSSADRERLGEPPQGVGSPAGDKAPQRASAGHDAARVRRPARRDHDRPRPDRPGRWRRSESAGANVRADTFSDRLDATMPGLQRGALRAHRARPEHECMGMPDRSSHQHPSRRVPGLNPDVALRAENDQITIRDLHLDAGLPVEHQDPGHIVRRRWAVVPRSAGISVTTT